MPRIFDNIELDLLPALRATLEDLGIRAERLARGSGETEFIQMPRATAMAARRKVVSAYGQAPNYTIGRLIRMKRLVPSPVGNLSP